MIHSQKLGRYSEDIAAEYLLSIGWKVLARNIRNNYGELDIISIDTTLNPEELVIVEVRSRTIGKVQSPIDSVGSRKLKTLVKSSRKFINEIEWEKFWRIDLIGITMKDKNNFNDWELSHVKDITSGFNILS